MAYPRFRRARAHKVVQSSAGDMTFTNATWVLAATALDMTLAAQPGDTIEYGVSGLWGNQVPVGELDVFLSASSRRTSGATRGYAGWSGQPSVYGVIGGSVMFTIGASDLVGGQVTMRLYGRSNGTASKTLFATDAAYPLQVWAKNLGPVDAT